MASTANKILIIIFLPFFSLGRASYVVAVALVPVGSRLRFWRDTLLIIVLSLAFAIPFAQGLLLSFCPFDDAKVRQKSEAGKRKPKKECKCYNLLTNIKKRGSSVNKCYIYTLERKNMAVNDTTMK